MQTYFETHDWEVLADGINSFRVFLTRNKTISESHKKSNQNFATVLSKIINLPPNNEMKTQELLQQIQEFSPLAEKDWLIEKMKECLNFS